MGATFIMLWSMNSNASSILTFSIPLLITYMSSLLIFHILFHAQSGTHPLPYLFILVPAYTAKPPPIGRMFGPSVAGQDVPEDFAETQNPARPRPSRHGSCAHEGTTLFTVSATLLPSFAWASGSKWSPS